MQPDLFTSQPSGDTPGPFTPVEFVALVNQTLEYAYPEVLIEGEVSGFNVNQGKFVFFDLKDSEASVGCFMMVFQLKSPLEDGMLVRVRASTKLTNKGRFSLTVREVVPVGEGAMARAFELLRAKLEREGLFAPERKRPIPAMPKTIGLISSESAAGATDFLTILDERWGGVRVLFAHVQVQGEAAPEQIVRAIDYFNQLPDPADVLVLVRGGGSLEDLWAFNTEPVTRAIAGSRTPTVVGVGHEADISLADLAADVRAATPTHAAQLVVPSRDDMLGFARKIRSELGQRIQYLVAGLAEGFRAGLSSGMDRVMDNFWLNLQSLKRSLSAYNPRAVLRRGYSVLRLNGGAVVSSVNAVKRGDTILAEVFDGTIEGEVRRAQKS